MKELRIEFLEKDRERREILLEDEKMDRMIVKNGY